MKQYIELLEDILENGTDKGDRTGTGTRSVFGRQIRFNLREGFPLVTTKKTHLRSIIHELLWFVRGRTDIKYLQDNGVTIWDEWVKEDGSIGPGYGFQWRNFGGVDQLSEVIESLKKNPDSRRLIVSAWNPPEITEMALPPCHMMFQYNTRPMSESERRQEAYKIRPEKEWKGNTGLPWMYTSEEMDELKIPSRFLDLQMYQRSVDSALGLPFNISSYALLLMMTAQVVNMVPGDFVWTGGDTHIYLNHLEGVKEQVAREPYSLPTMEINPRENMWDYEYEDFVLKNYEHHPHIKFDISV
jgi:thymidylate synthase